MTTKPTRSLKERTITGMIWSSVHRFGTMAISFITNLVLARILTPEDFGIIGMIMVFISISGALVDGGFASALIQKKNPTNEDYSTIFYWNLIVSIILFFALYLSAPAIERFYQMRSLAPILRVQGVVLIFNAFNLIQFNQLRKELNFKKLANISVLSTSTGAVIGITMAFMGYGVWSLVAKMISLSFFNSIFLWYSSNWRPGFVFSLVSFKALFKYGSFMLLTSILIKVYDNIKALIIGRVFSADDLGYFIQAQRMEKVPVEGLSAVVNQVTFPVFSDLQHDLGRLVRGVRKCLKAITFINFPIMVLLIVIAKPLITLLLTDKWAMSIPYFQILCIGGMVYTLNTVNNNILKSLGRSDLYFYVLLAKRIIGITLIIIGLQYGLIGMLSAVALNSYISFFIGMHYSSKLSGYKTSQQITDVAPAYILALLSGLASSTIRYYDIHLITILLQVFVYGLMYMGLAYVLNLQGYLIFKEILFKEKKAKI